MRIRVQRIAPTVPTASMADIAFLLIIFFMLTTSFSPERTSVALPKSETQAEVSDEAAIVAVTADGEIHFTDGEAPSQPMSDMRALGAIVHDLVQLAANKEFLIKADEKVRFEAVDDVLETLRNNGAKNIGMLTVRRAPKEPN